MAAPRVFVLGASLAIAAAVAGCNPPAHSSRGDNAPHVEARLQPVIALFTDFGTTDPDVAQMKGAILTIDPGARLLDVTHGVTPFDVMQGSYLLDQSAREYPAGTIFVAAVDTQADSESASILLKTGAGKFYVGPDNGLFSRVLDREGFNAAWKLDRRLYFRGGSESSTFRGRDIFGPIAAHLAQGTAPADMGTPLKQRDLEIAPAHAPAIAGGIVSVEVLHVDHYGNVILNLTRGSDAANKLHMGNLVKITIGRESFTGPLVRAYSAAEKGRLILLYGSNGLLEISMNPGSAAQKLKVEPGTILLLKP